MTRFVIRAAFIAASVFALAPAPVEAHAQDGAEEDTQQEAAAPEGPASTTEAFEACKDADIDSATLKAHVKAFTQEQLQELAGVWIGFVQEAETQVANAVVAEDEEAQKESVKARDALVAQAKTVVAELEAKGGDAAAQNAYLTTLTGVSATPSLTPADLDEALNMAGKVTDWFTAKDGGIKWGLNLIKFLVILFAFKIAATVLGKVVGKAVNRLKKASSLLKDFFVHTVMKVTMFVGFVIALSALGVNIGPFLAAMGAAGFVIAFALQGTLSNFAAGVMILVYRPYDIGHVVTAADVTGKVQAMTLVSTTLLTPDNQTIIVPNGSIWGSVITNITANDTRRVDMVFGIGYGDDIDKAQKLLEETLEAHPKVLKDLGITVKVNELADSSVNFIARPWTLTADYWDVYWDLQREVKMRFDKAGISIPFPQSDVHVHGLPQQADRAKA